MRCLERMEASRAVGKKWRSSLSPVAGNFTQASLPYSTGRIFSALEELSAVCYPRYFTPPTLLPASVSSQEKRHGEPRVYWDVDVLPRQVLPQ